jgi:signal transduction histidine kinase
MASVDLQTLAASTVHELKNLLGQLRLSLDDIAQTDCPEVAAQVAGARFACSRIADRMVELLTLYKLEGGQRAFSMEARSPCDFLEDLQTEIQVLAGGRVKVETADGGSPDFWFFDRELVQGAMMNALHNALAHARSRIVLRTTVRDGLLAFSVEDDGAGYPAHLLHADLAMPQASQKGTGLGLYFAQTVAKSHENKGRTGYVELTNAPSGGAVFSLFLP